jgi:3-dehydrosphinganine reductase
MKKTTYQGKTALITGGSSGIGLALAIDLARQGANIWLLARDGVKVEQACQQVTASLVDSSQQVSTFQADVSNYEELAAVLQPAMQLHGTPDLLINSAGTSYPKFFTDIDLDIHRHAMQVNYFGTLNTIHLLVPGMIARGSGHIVNISSIAGFHGVIGYSAYSPSKFAVRGLSDVLSYELKPHGIKVSVVFPPDTDTPSLAKEKKIRPLLLNIMSETYNQELQPDVVARNIIREVNRGQYLIAPGFDSLFFYLVNQLPWHMPYWIMNLMVADGRRRTAKHQASH